MNNIHAAIVREQGQTFSVVLVNNGYANQSTFSDLNRSLPSNLPRPIILAENSGRLFGKQDIVNFLSNISLNQLPWAEYSVQ